MILNSSRARTYSLAHSSVHWKTLCPRVWRGPFTMAVLRAARKCPKATSFWSPKGEQRRLQAEQALELDLEERPSFWRWRWKREWQQRSGRHWDEGSDKLGVQILKQWEWNEIFLTWWSDGVVKARTRVPAGRMARTAMGDAPQKEQELEKHRTWAWGSRGVQGEFHILKRQWRPWLKYGTKDNTLFLVRRFWVLFWMCWLKDWSLCFSCTTPLEARRRRWLNHKQFSWGPSWERRWSGRYQIIKGPSAFWN